MGADPRGDRRVDADARRQATVGIGDGCCRRHRRLADLNLESFGIAKERELAGGLEVVVLAVHREDMRIAVVGAVVGRADLEPKDRLVLPACGVGGRDVDVLNPIIGASAGVLPIPVSASKGDGSDRGACGVGGCDADDR